MDRRGLIARGILVSSALLIAGCRQARELGVRDDVPATIAATPAPATPTLIVETRADGIIIDRQSMAEASCHKMGRTIMGRCTPEDIARLVDEIRLMERVAAAATPDPNAEEVVLRLSEFKFESSAPRFRVGTPYRFVIHNTGVLSHEVVLLPAKHDDESGSHEDHDDDHGHEGTPANSLGPGVTSTAAIVVVDGQVMDHTGAVLEVSRHDLPPGATIVRHVTFEKSGAYEFQCHVPGHQTAGMRLAVEIGP